MPPNRADLFDLLAACFGPPDADLLAAALSGNLERAARAALNKLDAPPEQVEAALAPLRELPVTTTLTDLEVEYTYLFGGPGQPAIPPYGSVYLDREGTSAGELWGPSTRAVEALYRVAGLRITLPGEPPDHIAAELEFAVCLAEQEEAAHAAGDGAAAARAHGQLERFLGGHLGRWGRIVAERTANEAGHPLYRAAGHLLALALEQATGRR